MTDLRILYTDRDVAVAVKPAGILSQADRGGDADALLLLSARFRAEGARSEIYPIHRLDRGVGGMMVFARTADAAARLSSCFFDHLQTHKEYLAICHGRPAEDAGEMTDYLYHDERKRRTSVVLAAHPKGKLARLSFRCLTSETVDGKLYSLLSIRLYTGRTHQIRAQLSARGIPLAGDGRYGGRDRFASIALFAYKLHFPHPRDGRPLTFAAAPPDVPPFSFFSSKITDFIERSSP